MPMTDEAFNENLRKLKLYKQKIKTLEAKQQKLQKSLCREMARRDLTAVEYDDMRASMVVQHRTEYLVDRFQHELTPGKFKLITKPVIDKDKLQQQIAAGRIDPQVVAACTEVVPRSPYILISDR